MKEPNVWLSRYAKTTVVAAFCLMLIGSLVTTKGAGMAFADWPLSASSLNPEGWWSNLFQRLEHGHRLFAELTGCLIGILCAWIWANRWAIPTAFLASGILSVIASIVGAPRPWIAHIGLWSSALVFVGMLLWQSGQAAHSSPASATSHPPLTRWLALAAFVGVIAQAILGGMRVTIESGGNIPAATIFRIVHGCFAQVELCLLVAISVLLSSWKKGVGRNAPISGLDMTRALAWATFGLIFLQLIMGATMRHLGVGLIIPTFPQASADGSWFPAARNVFVDLSYAHTRLGAVLVGICGILLALRILRTATRESGLVAPAWLLLGLIAFQIALGILILVTHRSVLPTTLHVLNGAAILATSCSIALRTTFLQPKDEPFLPGHEPLPNPAA